MEERIRARLARLPGKLGFYYKSLTSGEEIAVNADTPMLAASVIKLYILAACYREMDAGGLDKNRLVTVHRSECVPSCGAIRYMHDGLQVTVEDLYTLMIILSDNSATNYLIDLLGMDRINRHIRALGFRTATLNRKMYDAEASARGIQNYISPRECGQLLEMAWRGALVNREASQDFLRILADQRLNGKIPFCLHALPNAPQIAHKTGEDEGITHDVGIVYAPQPFIVCFCGNETDPPAYEREMAEISLMLFEANQ